MKSVALVTGAARNIGKGIANTLLNAEYACILVDKDKIALSQTISELSADGRECYEYAADISDYEQIKALLAWTESQGLTITALINNAAYESPVPVAGITPTELAKSFQTNLAGPFYMTSLITNGWAQRKHNGSVIFTSSVHGHLIRTHPLYSASKAAIDMFVKEAAIELAKHNIRVNAVAPGPTQDTAQLKSDHRVPLGFYQQPQDIGEAVLFLISEKARFITGQTLDIDGGYGITHTHYWMQQGRL